MGVIVKCLLGSGLVVALFFAGKTVITWNAKRNFEISLEKLRRSPSDPVLRQQTLRLAAQYYDLIRRSGNRSMLDDPAFRRYTGPGEEGPGETQPGDAGHAGPPDGV